MHWIVQDNLFDEQGAVELVYTLERLRLRHDIVKVMPFSHELVPDVTPTNPVMVMGSHALTKIAAERGWVPGSFANEEHDFRRWRQHYFGHLLNSDAEVSQFTDITPFWQEFFIRPCDDSKLFAGHVITWKDYAEWRKKVMALDEPDTRLFAKTMVSYASVKPILSEYRFFVIDRQIVTSSLYRLDGRVMYWPDVDTDAAEFAQQMIDRWCPARGFALDIALTEDGYRVIEVNGLNSAGFYAAEVWKLVEAIESMVY